MSLCLRNPGQAVCRMPWYLLENNHALKQGVALLPEIILEFQMMKVEAVLIPFPLSALGKPTQTQWQSVTLTAVSLWWARPDTSLCSSACFSFMCWPGISKPHRGT